MNFTLHWIFLEHCQHYPSIYHSILV
uniref:Uncharacterized protein n=1 Tax=Rhizophora mucronata TaxID=61149 RepID=A0A2P2QRY6_RHIMU